MRTRQIRAALESLPVTLDETYDRLLRNLENCQQEALTLLQWLCFARRPLRIEELAEACIITPEVDKEVDEDDRFSPEEIIEILKSLVTTTSKLEDPLSQSSKKVTEVTLAHFSVQEYLISERIRSSQAAVFAVKALNAHSFIAQSCLAYITFYNNHPNMELSLKDLETFPLLQYASNSWYYHMNHLDEHRKSAISSRASSFLQFNDTRSTWLQVFTPDEPWLRHYPPARSLGSALYYASYLNLNFIVMALIEEGVNLNEEGGHFFTALQAAAYRGNTSAVKTLLDQGCNIDACGGRYGTALQAAATQGYEAIILLLLEHGADINANGGEYHSAIQAALYCAQDNAFRILLERGADAKLRGREYGDTLQTASWWGNLSAVKLLLHNGADVNAEGGEYSTALQAASYRGHLEIVNALLATGAQVNTKGGYYGSALQAAASQAHNDIVRLLLDAGAMINTRGGRYHTAIDAALYWGHYETAKILRDHGSDESSEYDKLKHEVLYGDIDKSIPLLHQRDGTLDNKDSFGRTLLLLAVRNGNLNAVQKLLQAGASITETDVDHGKSALHWAAELGHLLMVHCLLGYGARIHVQDKYGETALHYAAECGHLDIVRLLVSKGADPLVIDKSNRTPLLCAQYRQHTDVVHWLESME